MEIEGAANAGSSGRGQVASSKVVAVSGIIGVLVGAVLYSEIADEYARQTVQTKHVPEKYDPSTSGIEGYLIDLDGTMYTPGGLVPGATEFLSFLVDNKKPFVFLSNTGSKTSQGVQDKLAALDVHREKVPLDHIWTAADSQMDMMTDPHNGIPEGSHLFVLSGFRADDGQNSQQWLDDMKARNPALVRTWTVKTALSLEEAQIWGNRGSSGHIKTYVVMFHDGPISSIDPMSPTLKSANYEKDWSFALMAKVGAILITGRGSLVYPAADPFNPSKGWVDPSHPGDADPLVYPLPGPGMMAALFRSLMYPYEDDSRILCAGKGGALGKKFMMKKAIEMLKKQGHSGDKSKIAMIGDRFDTDIRGGVNAGMKTIHLASGVHSLDVQSFYSDAPATWFASTVRDLVPAPPLLPSSLRAGEYAAEYNM